MHKVMGLVAGVLAAVVLINCGPAPTDFESEQDETLQSELVLPDDGAQTPDDWPRRPRPRPPLPPAPSPEQVRYEQYLYTAGFESPSELGKVKEIDGCSTRAFQGAGTFNRGVTARCEIQPSEPFYVIQGISVNVTKNKNGRGSWSSGVIGENGQFDRLVRETGDKWKVAIELAAKAKDVEVKRKLELEYQRFLETVYSVHANKNTAYLEVTANGGAFAKSEIEATLKVRLIRVR